MRETMPAVFEQALALLESAHSLETARLAQSCADRAQHYLEELDGKEEDAGKDIVSAEHFLRWAESDDDAGNHEHAATLLGLALPHLDKAIDGYRAAGREDVADSWAIGRDALEPTVRRPQVAFQGGCRRTGRAVEFVGHADRIRRAGGIRSRHGRGKVKSSGARKCAQYRRRALALVEGAPARAQERRCRGAAGRDSVPPHGESSSTPARRCAGDGRTDGRKASAPRLGSSRSTAS